MASLTASVYRVCREALGRDLPRAHVAALVAEAVDKLDCPLASPFLGEELSKRDEEEVERIARRVLKDKTSEDHLIKVSKSVLVQLFKSLYTQRAAWQSSITSAKAD